MPSPRPRRLVASALVAASALLPFAGCAGSSPCHRKARFLTERCAGTSIAAAPDPLCEAKTEACSPAQKAQLEGYVGCLESAGECSLEVLRACRQRWPGGVNLSCG